MVQRRRIGWARPYEPEHVEAIRAAVIRLIGDEVSGNQAFERMWPDIHAEAKKCHHRLNMQEAQALVFNPFYFMNGIDGRKENPSKRRQPQANRFARFHRSKKIGSTAWLLKSAELSPDAHGLLYGAIRAGVLTDLTRREGVFVIVAAQVNQDGNTRGGEGLRLACDLYSTLHRDKDDDGAWLEMGEIRISFYRNVGSKIDPGLILDPHGPHFRDA